jgi:hypothetical protein
MRVFRAGGHIARQLEIKGIWLKLARHPLETLPSAHCQAECG